MSENIKRCVDCFHYNACKDWVDGWVGPRMVHFPYEADADDDLICDYFTPATDVAEVQHGKWCDGICTNCGHEALDYLEETPCGCTMRTYITKFCPNCGARMDAERSEQ